MGVFRPCGSPCLLVDDGAGNGVEALGFQEFGRQEGVDADGEVGALFCEGHGCFARDDEATEAVKGEEGGEVGHQGREAAVEDDGWGWGIGKGGSRGKV